jgi:2-deoxy-D-gluconate 3-dehydrogenase
LQPFDLKGRVAIVTGGNGGIGLGMARGLAAAGAKVVVAGRNAQKSAAAAKEIGGIAIDVDVKSEAWSTTPASTSASSRRNTRWPSTTR